MKPTNKTYKALQTLILASEGKTLEDEYGFGVRVKLLVGGTEEKIGRFIGYNQGEQTIVELEDSNYHCLKREIKEILGQDITLERVMVALGSQCMNMAINEDGFFMRSKPLDSYESLGFRWDFCLPAHLQEEETILKLIEILS